MVGLSFQNFQSKYIFINDSDTFWGKLHCYVNENVENKE